VTARAHHAYGYDRLRADVCTDDEAMSGNRAGACSTMPAGLEDGWRRSDRREQKVVRVVATGVYAGAITAAFVEPDRDAGRGIATAAGAPLGALTGMTVLMVAVSPLIGGAVDAKPGSFWADHQILAASVVLGAEVVGAAAGGAAGGWAAHSL